MKANFSGFHPKPWKDSVNLPEPNNKLDEVGDILYGIAEECGVFNFDIEPAKSAINSLTLKQVLALIGEDEPIKFKDKTLVKLEEWELMLMARNELKAELRQEAERIYGSN